MQFLDMKFECNNTSAWCDFAILDKKMGNTLLLASVFGRSNVEVKGLTANMRYHTTTIRYADKAYEVSKLPLDAYFNVTDIGYEKITHGMIVSNKLKDNYIVTSSKQNDLEEHFYSYLMHNYDLPILKSWIPAIVDYCLKNEILESVEEVYTTMNGNQSLKLYGRMIDLDSVKVYKVWLSQVDLDEIIGHLFEQNVICITEKPQQPLYLVDMDGYFANYGHTIVNNLEKNLTPEGELVGYVDTLALKNKTLYPQQAAIVNGVAESLRKRTYGLLNCDMGTGKSIQAASIVESYYVKRYMRMYPKKSLKDIYMSSDTINYRVALMCPGHLTEKWKREIEDEIPYANVTIVRKLSQLMELKESGSKRSGREFFLFSKDFMKLSYSFAPVPTLYKTQGLPVVRCRGCSNIGLSKDHRDHLPCCCGRTDWEIIRSIEDIQTGLICSGCGELISKEEEAMTAVDFKYKTDSNSFCTTCGSSLWKPFVSNLGSEQKASKWYKITGYANRTKKTKKTFWVMNGKEHEALDQEWNTYVPTKIAKTRKISPALYIKKQLKGFFDFAIFDEAHKYKGGNTAQGWAFHVLKNATKRSLALTGTIAGGRAEDFFYLFYRLDSRKMKRLGFEYNSESAFISTYGNQETLYEYKGTPGNHLSSSRGKQLGAARSKPGISPLIYPDLLIDCSVALNIYDMGKNLPDLNEYVEFMDLPENIMDSYRRTIDRIKSASGSKLSGLSSTLLNFSMYYPDMPYGYGNIIHPSDGYTVASPEEFKRSVRKFDALFPKEKYLVDLISKEIEEEKNVFVFVENTDKRDITSDLQKIIELHCGLEGKVEVLKANTVSTTEREGWLKDRLKTGTKVVIGSPSLVETGMDFAFEEDGEYYNIPTIVFMQLNYSLFTQWQASRRHFRLNQKENCKTYYLAYRNTLQQELINIMGLKRSATSAIQGDFSTSALSAMAQGVDERVRLAQALARGSFSDSDDAKLKEMIESNSSKMYENPDYDNLDMTGVKSFSQLTGILTDTIEPAILPGNQCIIDADEVTIDEFVVTELANEKVKMRPDPDEYVDAKEEAPIVEIKIQLSSVEVVTRTQYRKGIVEGQVSFLDMF